ncbi:MAG: CHAT domain-containing protein [Saprospiraceae bacterium]|jgi:tetratricopeptide (TPR) repeat protein|nr:CHAT domain-containing protein [Saprospiraceae bacterium]
MTKPNAFLSHASKDDPFVQALRQALEIHGAGVWVDSRELLPGDVLQTEIEQAIARADVFFLVFSGHTIQSKWVKKELEFAKARQKRIVMLLLDEQTVGALAWLFDDEPVAIPLTSGPGGLQAALPALLTALGLRLPDDPAPDMQPPEPSVSELLLVLENPALYTEGGVRRGSARARLEYLLADGSEQVQSDWFHFISPLGPDVADRIRRYIEEYPRYPFLEKIQADVKAVENQLPGWGKALFDAITADESARLRLLEWKGDKQHERRFSIKMDAAAPAALSEEQKPEFHEAAGLLLATPWEMLHDGQGFLFQGQQPVRVRRMQPNRKKKAPMPLQTVLRILLVAPRPEDKMAGLIDHRAATRALLQVTDTLGDLAELDILETPTFPALAEKIRDAAGQGKPYSVVHFDGHGVFDQNKGLGALCFESAEAGEQAKLEGRATAVVDAQALAAELNELRIPLFFLDACQSAQTDHDPKASVAATLLENGVASVAAMSHSVLVSAAERFAGAFYQKLAEGTLIGAAMLAGQRALHADPVRVELPGNEKLRLQDWFVPVLFQEKKDPQLVRRTPSAPVRQLLENQWAQKMGATPPAPAHGFVGRVRELLALERLLLRERYAVLIGLGGSGKTTLATELARWLLRTRRVQRLVFVSFDSASKEPVRDTRAALDALGRQLLGEEFSALLAENEEKALLQLDRRLQEYSTLLVLDNLESILPDAEGQTPPGVQPATELLEFFTRLRKNAPATRLLLTTRERLPAPFDAAKNTVRIGPLVPHDALRLIADVMKNAGIEVPGLNAEDLDKQFGALARTANYHARALTLLTQTLAGRSAAEREPLLQLNADLSHLMAELEQKHPGDRENSLFASLELSLRRLPAEVGEVVDVLAVYHGGADVVTWAMVAECERDVATQAGMALIQVGLAELALDEFPYFFKTDPALSAFLAARTPPERLEARRWRWVEGMVALRGFLYQQQIQNIQLTYDLTRLTETNLLAMLTVLEKHAEPEKLVNEAGKIEGLFSRLSRPQVMEFAQNIRERAAARLSVDSGWNHSQFMNKQATVERLQDQGDLNAAYQTAQALLEHCERAGDAYPGAEYDGAHSFWLLGKTLKNRGQANQALPFLQTARQRFLTLAAEGNASAGHMASVCLTDMGDCFRYLGQYDSAIEHFIQSIEIAEKSNDFRQVNVGKAQLAATLIEKKYYPEALKLFAEVKTFFVRNHESATVATVLHQIGIAHQEMQNYPAAEKAYLESLKIDIREKNKLQEASSLVQLGNLYQVTGRLEDAVCVIERAIAVYVELKDAGSEGVCRNNLASALLLLRRRAEARDQLLHAVECDAQFGHEVQPWTTWKNFYELETEEGNTAAAADARQKAMRAYAAYRHDGGESKGDNFHMIKQTVQAIQSGQTGELVQISEDVLQQDSPSQVKALARALLTLLHGSRDPALADDPELDYMDAVDLRLVFFEA